MLRSYTTKESRRTRLNDGVQGERRAKTRHHVSMACDQCRQRKRGCTDSHLAFCEVCHTEHQACNRCVQDKQHCTFPPPESDGRRTSNRMLAAELEVKLQEKEKTIQHQQQHIQRLEELLLRHGGDPSMAKPSLSLQIPDANMASDASEYSPSPASLTSPGSSSWYSPSSVSPQSALTSDGQQDYLSVPGQPRLRLKKSSSLSDISTQASPATERGYPLSANSSPLPSEPLQLDQDFGDVVPTSSATYAFHTRSLSDTVTATDADFAMLAQYQAMNVHQGNTTSTFGLDQLHIPTLHVYHDSPPAPTATPQQDVSSMLVDHQYITYDSALQYGDGPVRY